MDLFATKDLEFSPIELLRQCRLDDWEFRSSCQRRKRALRHTTGLPTCRLRSMFPMAIEAYVQERRAAGSEQIKKIYNLMRRIEREVGPLSFVASSMDPSEPCHGAGLEIRAISKIR